MDLQRRYVLLSLLFGASADAFLNLKYPLEGFNLQIMECCPFPVLKPFAGSNPVVDLPGPDWLLMKFTICTPPI